MKENKESKLSLTEVLNYYEKKLNDIHSNINTQYDSETAAQFVEKLVSLKMNICSVKLANFLNDESNKRCNRLLEKAKYLIAYFSVFVDKAELKKILENDRSEELLNLF